MPKSLKVSKYPAGYFKLFQAADEHGSLTVGPKPRPSIESLRFDIYGFLRALEAEGFAQARQWQQYKLTITDDDQGAYLNFVDVTAEFADIFDALPVTSEQAGDVELEPIEDPTDAMGDLLADLGYNTGDDDD